MRRHCRTMEFTNIVIFFVLTVQVFSENVSNDNLKASSNPCTDSNHLFLAPGVLSSGATNRICLSRFYTESAATLSLTVTTADNNTATFRKDLPSGEAGAGGCIDVPVPQLPHTQVELTVTVDYATCQWVGRVVSRAGGTRAVLVQTSRARYRRPDLMQARVLAIPSPGEIAPKIEEIWLEAPAGAWGAGARVAEWLRARTRLGLAQVQYRLEDAAPAGRWTVRARLEDGSLGSSTFWVGDYALPPFQLSVRHAPRVLRAADRLAWTVCVRYPWGEAVEGMLVIRMWAEGADADMAAGATAGAGAGAGAGGVRTVMRLSSSRVCHRHAVAADRLGLAGSDADVVVAHFSFKEEGTGIWQNTSAVSYVVDRPVTLQILSSDQQDAIAPGLPYKIKIKATRFDDKPAVNQTVTVCRLPQNTDTINSSFIVRGDKMAACSDVTTNEKGYGVVYLRIANEDVKFYTFQASLKNDSSTRSSLVTLPVQTSPYTAAFGFLLEDDRSTSGGNRRATAPLYINFKGVKRPVTVHYVVTTNGGTLLRWGTTTQCPTLSRNIQDREVSPNTHCNDRHLYNLDESPEEDILKFLLPLKMSQKMCPESTLFAYFKYKGEIVSASKQLVFEDCFPDKVDIAWSSRRVPPGATVSLRLTTPAVSLCAVSAVDVATKWLSGREPTVEDVVMDGLRRVAERKKNATMLDACCYLESSTPAPLSPLRRACHSALRVAGGGGDVTAPHCDVTRLPPMSLEVKEEDTQTREDFSESWLWRLVRTEATGRGGAEGRLGARAPHAVTRHEARALCAAPAGLALSPLATIQVFKEFFIHAEAPRRLRRGDQTMLQYRVFNYLHQPITISTLILPSPHFSPTPPPPLSQVPPRSSIARRVTLEAKLVGGATVAVRVTGTVNGSVVSDEVVMKIQIDHEGIPVREQRSALLCGRESNAGGPSEMSWVWSNASIVAGSESVTLWAMTDIRGPLLADSDSLVPLPRGCGEQNLARLATNLLALRAAAPPRDSVPLHHVARGFARQLQYALAGGGFSAFGARDSMPSTWLTAFAVRYMRRAHQALYPNTPVPDAVERAEQWLINQQLENGCFRNDGQVFHRELMGGAGSEGEAASVALTAYAVTSLLESGRPLAGGGRLLADALHCLRAMPPHKNKNLNRVYAQSLITYAFMRLKKHEEDLKRSNEASPLKKSSVYPGLREGDETRELAALINMASRTSDSVWWDTGSLSTSIEATGYALLSLCECVRGGRSVVTGGDVGDRGEIGDGRDRSGVADMGRCAQEARGAVRWLAAHRNPTGGFHSTQDTLVALEALSAWYSLTQGGSSGGGAVSLWAGGRRATLQPADSLPTLMNIQKDDRVTVEGNGCALVQATRSYNTLDSDADSRDKSLSVQVSVTTDGPFDCQANTTSCFCAAVVEVCVVWTGVGAGAGAGAGAGGGAVWLLEVSAAGGAAPLARHLHRLLPLHHSLVRRIEMTSSSRTHIYLSPRDATAEAGHQCLSIPMVGPKARTKPAYVRIMDYYRPEINDTQFYTIPEDCPPRVSQESNAYNRRDNLFTSARSLDDELIMDDYFIDNIPDGITGYEDPFYDNLEDITPAITNNDKSRIIDDTETVFDKTTHENVPQLEAKTAETEEARPDKNNEILTPGVNVDAKIEMAPEIIGDTTKDDKTIDLNKDTETIGNIASTPASEESVVKVENPKLADFHVIDTEVDLEVPPGVEGPVPAVVLPPPEFINSMQATAPPHYEAAAANEKFPKHLPYDSYVDYYYAPYRFEVPSHIRMVREVNAS